METTARERLEQCRAVCYRWRHDPAWAAFWYTIACAALLFFTAYFKEIPPFSGILSEMNLLHYAPVAVRLYWTSEAVVLLTALIMPVGIVFAWRSSYLRFSKLLRGSMAGPLLLQPEVWASDHDAPRKLPWLRFETSCANGGLVRQIEYTACHWRSWLAIIRHKNSQVVPQLTDSVTWLCERPLSWAIGYWGVGAMALAVLPLLMSFISLCVLLIAGFIVCIPLILCHTQNQAAQVAIIDYLLE